MNIVILTSKDHLYGNFVLNRLFASGVFNSHRLTVVEQAWIIPGRSNISSLFRYLKTCGFRYVFAQALKQKIFVVLRAITSLRGTKESSAYPYYRLPEFAFPRISKHLIGKDKTLDWIRSLSPDLILSVYSKEILPQTVLDLPLIGCVNVHPAPLPAYKGVSPTFWCLAEGAAFGGTTLHWMEKSIDTGKIISRILVPLEGIKTEHELYLRCSEGAVQLILAFLNSTFIQKNTDSTQQSTVSLPASYRSLPTRKAIICFRKHKISFFTFKELLSLLSF
ncbi:MAG TPA: hypothetical protein DCO75_09650 [Fibrobacteres bacterium]|nr:hypothetical protein [Fibrobacterota bacterium]